MKVTISQSNTKLGMIPTISLPPIITCRKNAPCTKDCYGTRGNYRFKNVKKSMETNLLIYKSNEKDYFKQIKDYIDQDVITYKYFRWHSVGDIPDSEYFENMINLAKELPQTKFLAFTKQYEIVNEIRGEYENFPKNLQIIFSAWGNQIDVPNPYNFPVAHVKFKDETMNTRIPGIAKQCTGDCTNCLKCWNIQHGDAVVFKKH